MVVVVVVVVVVGCGCGCGCGCGIVQVGNKFTSTALVFKNLNGIC